MLSVHCRSLGCTRRLQRIRVFSFPSQFSARFVSTVPDPGAPVKPRRPSPYRLLSPITFLSTFAPLHVAGWRLLQFRDPHQVESSVSSIQPEHGDLQDRRLVRLFGFEDCGDAISFVYRAKMAIEEEDHHPTISITPSSDYVPPNADFSIPEGRYLVEISAQTHTPLPSQPGAKGKMRPGVTTKDIGLAERIEAIHRELEE